MKKEYASKNCTKNTPLDEEKVVWMRERYREGVTATKIAEEVGVSYNSAIKAIKGQTWSWVGGKVEEDWKEKKAALDKEAKEFEKRLLAGLNAPPVQEEKKEEVALTDRARGYL